ncbi:MAG: hypothetical protein OQK98_11560 [Gammaproteobacteria bacterium]|nr:hypothetical protein [Gammaproteobacteria bacterium]
MKNNLSLSKLFIFLTFIIASGCANSDTPSDKLLSSIDESIKQGKTVIVYQMNNMDKTSEQYADWSAYLNSFMEEKANTYKVYSANKAFNTKLSKIKIDTGSSYTIFLKQGKPTYYYDDVIVEPMVYIAVDNQYSAKKLSAMDTAFLPDVINFQE